MWEGVRMCGMWGWDRGDKVQVHVKWCRCERSGAEAMKRCRCMGWCGYR